MLSALEKKVNMSLDDIIKSTTSSSSRGARGGDRRKAAQDERIPATKNGLAPKFINTGESQQRKSAPVKSYKPQPLKSYQQQLNTRRAPLKKTVNSRSSIPATAPRSGGRAGNTGRNAPIVRVTIQNTPHQAARSAPPPGFPKFTGPSLAPPAKGGNKGGRTPTLDERFTQVISAPAAAGLGRRRRGSRNRRGGNSQGAAAMEM